MSNWPGTNTPKSTGNAFDGVIPCFTPFTDVHSFRTRTYARWLVVVKDAPMSHPSWEQYRDSQNERLAKRQKPGKAISISTVGTVKGLSKQAREQLAKAPKSISMGTLSDGRRRSRIRKASI